MSIKTPTSPEQEIPTNHTSVELANLEDTSIKKLRKGTHRKTTEVIDKTKLINPRLGAKKFYNMVAERTKALFAEELSPLHETYCRLDDGKYMFFSALNYVDPRTPFITPRLINRLQKGASLLSVGSGPANLERVLNQGFNIPNITCSDIDVYPELKAAGLKYYQFDMLQTWPSIAEKFDYIIFPESLGVAVMAATSSQNNAGNISQISYRFRGELDEIVDKTLKNEEEELPSASLDFFLKVVEKDVAHVSYIYRAINSALQLLKPKGQILISFGISNEQQKAYIQIKLKRAYPGIKFSKTPTKNYFYIELP